MERPGDGKGLGGPCAAAVADDAARVGESTAARRYLPAARSVAEARRLYRSGRSHDRLRRIRRLPQSRPRRRARTAPAAQAELRDRRQGDADLRPQPGLPGIAAARAGDFTRLLSDAG